MIHASVHLLRNKWRFGVPFISQSLFLGVSGCFDVLHWDGFPFLLPISWFVVYAPQILFSSKYYMDEDLQDRACVWGGFLQKAWNVFKAMGSWWDMSDSSLLGQRNHGPVKRWKTCTLEEGLGVLFKLIAALSWILCVCIMLRCHGLSMEVEDKASDSKHFCSCCLLREIASASLCCFAHIFLSWKLMKAMQHGSPTRCCASPPLALFMETGQQNPQQVCTFMIFLLWESGWTAEQWRSLPTSTGSP